MWRRWKPTPNICQFDTIRKNSILIPKTGDRSDSRYPGCTAQYTSTVAWKGRAAIKTRWLLKAQSDFKFVGGTPLSPSSPTNERQRTPFCSSPSMHPYRRRSQFQLYPSPWRNLEIIPFSPNKHSPDPLGASLHQWVVGEGVQFSAPLIIPLTPSAPAPPSKLLNRGSIYCQLTRVHCQLLDQVCWMLAGWWLESHSGDTGIFSSVGNVILNFLFPTRIAQN